jgi:predicted metalloprotease
MRWQDRRRSTNVEDRRGSSVPGGRPVKIGGGLTILALLAALVFGIDPSQILSLASEGGGLSPSTGSIQADSDPSEDVEAEFASTVLANTEEAWTEQFRASGAGYRAPILVLYRDRTDSACGVGSSATGPFYCPGDDRLYLDLSFLGELQAMGAGGDFAVAYVIAHEVGHHIQNLTGDEEQASGLMRRLPEREANAVSVLVELQADCYAGIWANYASRDADLLEEGDIEEGLRAAAAVGDDRLQRAAGRSVQPESFTHGSSAQRTEWFMKGYRSGSVQQCDTFAGAGMR